MKETTRTIQVKAYTDEGKPVCGKCQVVPAHRCMRNKWDVIPCRWFPGPECYVWHGESKGEWQPISTAPKDEPILLWDGEDVGIGFAAKDGDTDAAIMWTPLPSLPQEKQP